MLISSSEDSTVSAIAFGFSTALAVVRTIAGSARNVDDTSRIRSSGLSGYRICIACAMPSRRQVVARTRMPGAVRRICAISDGTKRASPMSVSGGLALRSQRSTGRSRDDLLVPLPLGSGRRR